MSTVTINPRVPIPSVVNLCGIRYRVQESEGLIVFTEGPGHVWGNQVRLSFERRCGIWHVAIGGTHAEAPLSHVIRASEFVKAAYGDSFEGIDGPDRP